MCFQIDVDDICAISLSGQMQDVIFALDDGKTLGPAILYCDSRAVHEAEAIETQFGKERISRETGLIARAVKIRNANYTEVLRNHIRKLEGLSVDFAEATLVLPAPRRCLILSDPECNQILARGKPTDYAFRLSFGMSDS